MLYRNFEKIGVPISAFGLGCMRFPTKEVKGADGSTGQVVDQKLATELIRGAIERGVNYIDTAYVYSEGKNESVVGKALEGGYRERVYLATKLPVWNCNTKEDLPRLFEEQCRNLQTDVIDFYLVHALNGEKWDQMLALGIREFLDDLKAKGRIRYACFSFHDSYDAFERIFNGYNWDMCQLQYNFMDVHHQAGIKGLELAASRGVPVVIMEGLRGGKLASAPNEILDIYRSYPEKRTPVEWAFRWLCHHPQILTVLSGVTSMEQLEDNIRIFSEAGEGCMTEEEIALMAKVTEAYEKRTKAGCTNCRYCMPCPAGVDIPGIFHVWNEAYQYGQELSGLDAYAGKMRKGKGADLCVGCRACESVCPQQLPVSELLEKAHSEMK